MVLSLLSRRRLALAQLIVRNLAVEIVRRLKIRAAERGRSAEAEHREILRQALFAEPESSLKSLLLSMPAVGDDSDFERVRDLGRDVEL